MQHPIDGVEVLFFLQFAKNKARNSLKSFFTCIGTRNLLTLQFTKYRMGLHKFSATICVFIDLYSSITLQLNLLFHLFDQNITPHLCESPPNHFIHGFCSFLMDHIECIVLMSYHSFYTYLYVILFANKIIGYYICSM